MTASDVGKATAAESTSPNGKTNTAASPNAKEASPSKTESTDRRKDALNHFVAGKRHLLVKDLDAALTSLALASELLSAEYGETAYECADAYYYYGKALLEMARAEAGVFGNALDGVPEGEDSDNSQVEDPDKMTEDERTDVEKKVGDALDENFQELEEKKEKRAKRNDSTEEETEEESNEEESEKEPEKEKGEASEKKDEESETKESDTKKGEATEAGDAEMKDEESVGDNDAQEKEGEDKKQQEAEDEEDPSNLQLAWEMLELAKVAYTNKLEKATEDEKKAVEVKICETLLTLGEVSLESETYEQAVADITDCLNKRKALYAADSRRIAETHYHLGVALGHFNKFDEAVKSLEESITCLQLRTTNLKNQTESKDESKADDAFYTREAEIAEIESLIPEIQEKIQDTKDMKEQGKQEETETGFSKSGESSSEAKPISTISVKRKAEGSDSTSPKKAHLENGDAKA